ncbi:MAG: hypothetical protein JWO84_813 [Parcubacteria group bacterium]|nr:hypothetical protein [Parcubacteria group bacterium]
MHFSGKRALAQQIHDLLCGGILRTPPLEVRPSPVSICSLVSGRDFYMYLVAIKSFYAQLGQANIYAIDDGSLTADQRRLLCEQVRGITLLHISDAPRKRVPKGGCWERLLYMIQLAQMAYVIQLDSDTLTRQPLAEVIDACIAQTPFILSGDQSGARILSREAASQEVTNPQGQHIQTVMERRLAEAEGLKPCYVRGCAAFFGLPRGALSFDEVEEFSEYMTGMLGTRWNEWGTEQATVNYFVANLPGTSILQPPKYTHRWKVAPGSETAFIHFIGTHRFENQFYALQSRKVIKALRHPLFRPGRLGGAIA